MFVWRPPAFEQTPTSIDTLSIRAPNIVLEIEWKSNFTFSKLCQYFVKFKLKRWVQCIKILYLSHILWFYMDSCDYVVSRRNCLSYAKWHQDPVMKHLLLCTGTIYNCHWRPLKQINNYVSTIYVKFPSYFPISTQKWVKTISDIRGGPVMKHLLLGTGTI